MDVRLFASVVGYKKLVCLFLRDLGLVQCAGTLDTLQMFRNRKISLSTLIRSFSLLAPHTDPKAPIPSSAETLTALVGVGERGMHGGAIYYFMYLCI